MKEMLSVLDAVQKQKGLLEIQDIGSVSDMYGLSPAEVYSAASFYDFFSFENKIPGGHIENIYPLRKRGRLLARSTGYEGYAAAARDPEKIIGLMESAGLTGRSGGGFPTAAKWKITASAAEKERYVVCNADEGEPGTGKDRVILAENPEAVIEGMAICALAVHSSEGFIYLRAEYADLAPGIQEAIDAASFPGFHIGIRMGHGAYVCGEETALLNSMEGRRGETRLKPPFPGVSGYIGKPTVVNNTETFACVSLIMRIGAEEFKASGTPDCPGPKLFTVSGCVQYPGVYEAQAGMPISELLAMAGGATQPVQAILTGGGSGTLIHGDEDFAFSPSECAKHGASFGVASLCFYSKSDNLLDAVIRLNDFFVHESCGTCTPCRVGLQRIGDLLRLAQNGEYYEEHDAGLKRLISYIRSDARCALGKAAVTPTSTLLLNFPEVLYENHH